MVFHFIANEHVAATVTLITSDAYLSDSQESITDGQIEPGAVGKLNTGSSDIHWIDHSIPRNSVIRRPPKCNAVPSVDDKVVRNVILV